jgi:hypothetical protein
MLYVKYFVYINHYQPKIMLDLHHPSSEISGKVAGSIPYEVTGFFSLPDSSSRTMALGSIQRLREMSTGHLPGGKGRPARKADNLTTICEPIV